MVLVVIDDTGYTPVVGIGEQCGCFVTFGRNQD